jgi:hypothetical protein
VSMLRATFPITPKLADTKRYVISLYCSPFSSEHSM